MEQGTRPDGVLSETGPAPRRALSCVIGHLFQSIEPPCEAEIAGEITITGTTRSGARATLAVTGGAFTFTGDMEDMEAATAAAARCTAPCALRRPEDHHNAG